MGYRVLAPLVRLGAKEFHHSKFQLLPKRIQMHGVISQIVLRNGTDERLLEKKSGKF